MKSFLPLLACLSLLGVCCRPLAGLPPMAAVDLRTAAERVEAKSVAILDEDSMRPDCGGVWVSPNEVLTALHCVVDNGKPATDLPKAVADLLEALGALAPWDPTGHAAHYRVKGVDRDLSAVVSKIDREDDLALLLASPGMPDHDWARVSPRVIHDGDEVDIVGSTIGLPFSYSHGYVSSTRSAATMHGKFETLQISGPVYAGNSGGGAFDAYGDLIGIADYMRVGRDGPVPCVSFFVHRDVLRAFLTA